MIPKDIQEIKSHLLDMLGEIDKPMDFPTGKNFYPSDNLVDFLVWASLKEPKLLKKYECVKDKKLSDERKRQLLISVIHPQKEWQVRESDGRYGTYKHYELRVTDSLVNHYSTLLNLISYIKLVENLHIALCQSNEESGEFPKEYLFMIGQTKIMEG